MSAPETGRIFALISAKDAKGQPAHTREEVEHFLAYVFLEAAPVAPGSLGPATLELLHRTLGQILGKKPEGDAASRRARVRRYFEQRPAKRALVLALEGLLKEAAFDSAAAARSQRRLLGNRPAERALPTAARGLSSLLALRSGNKRG
ncbi:MAG: hypothetical protein IT384_16230 [Deltaproteobacteria bacterium]|nr:hypothetical protein [Deltaproteobacteria bacterium]